MRWKCSSSYEWHNDEHHQWSKLYKRQTYDESISQNDTYERINNQTIKSSLQESYTIGWLHKRMSAEESYRMSLSVD